MAYPFPAENNVTLLSAILASLTVNIGPDINVIKVSTGNLEATVLDCYIPDGLPPGTGKIGVQT